MKLLIFILSYNAERHIESVFEDIPLQFKNSDNAQILLIDDASSDKTVEVAQAYAQRAGLKNVRLLKNKINQGYGGNQKVGYTYAIREGFDVVVMLHGDNQYTPKALPDLIEPFRKDRDMGCVLGVRFGRRYSPLSGGMPLYKFIGNRILTWMQNRFAGVRFSEWHTGYRAYAVKALSKIGFTLNTNDFHFDTEILLQLIKSGSKFIEINIPTHYGDEICRVNGINYARNVMKASFKFMLQKYYLFYDVRFHPEVVFGDISGEFSAPVYDEKMDFQSPHSIVCNSPTMVPNGAKVLDVGSSSGYVAQELTRRKGCQVTGVDMLPPSQVSNQIFRYEKINLETQEEQLIALVKNSDFDVILMLDLLEHVAMPEKFMLHLSSLPYKKAPHFICSTANVGFVVVRLMLLFGHFNYGQRGILDITHKRLFSAHTFRNLMEQTGFVIQKEVYIPFPFRVLGFSERMANIFEKLNLFFIKIRPRLFSYQIMLEAIPLTTPVVTLSETIRSELKP